MLRACGLSLPADAPQSDTDSPVAGVVQPGPDGRLRCPWALGWPDYLDYHDHEWGRPVRGDVALFERLSLEGFQAGLSWITILRKRPAFRAAFAAFDPSAVAAFGPGDVTRLLADAGIVRNRAKIEATIGNARALLAMWERRGEGALDALIWEHQPSPAGSRPARMSEVPSTSPGSVRLSRALREQGFSFVGPTTCYAAMQACGLVDDHLAGCVVASSIREA